MLDLAVVDMADLCVALEDHSYEASWWLDPRTGEIRYHVPDVDDESDEDLDDAGFSRIDPIASHEAYRDMEDFVTRVPDRRAADLLGRSIQGRGAFRRFKDTLFEFPELRERWFAFHDARMRRRAIWWLAAEGFVSHEVAKRAADEYPDPPVGERAVDIDALARDVARDLRVRYGERLAEVLVFGSHARGDAGKESDLDLLVLLVGPVDPWEELRRIDDVLWHHSQLSGVTVGVPGQRRRLRRAHHTDLDPRKGRSTRSGVSSVDLVRRARREVEAARVLHEGGFAPTP
ncbi:hypothetical protein BH23ACT8_BH23ACT8_04710 [soil metagenome]